MIRKFYADVTAISVQIKALLLVGFIALACGGGEWYEGYGGQSFFSQEVMGPTRFQPFFNTDSQYPYDDEDHIYDEHLANATEWVKYFKQPVTVTDAQAFIYSDSLELSKSKGVDTLLERKFAGNTFYKALKSDKPAFDYLAFAKRCEPYVTISSDWSELADLDTIEIQKLQVYAEVQIAKVTSPILKLRYAYQLVRLANYTGHWSDCISYYDKYVEPNKTKSIIRYWALSLKARALYKIPGRADESQYAYAMVFDRCHTRRHMARQGFRWAWRYSAPYDYETNAAPELDPRQYCKDKYEKIAVMALEIGSGSSYAGYVYENSFLLDSIYILDPKSEMLEWLVMCGISELEDPLLPPHSNYYDRYNYYADYEDNEVQQPRDSGNYFQQFLLKVAANNNTRNPQLWDFSAAYTCYLTGDNAMALKLIDKANAKGKMPALMADETRVLQALIRIEDVHVVNTQFENALLKDIEWLSSYEGKMNNRSGLSLIWLALRDKYIAQQQLFKAALAQKLSSQGFDPWQIKEADRIDELIVFQLRPDKSEFEQLIAYSFSIDELYEIKGTIHLCAHQFDEAVAAYNRRNGDMEELPADPFIIHMQDCHDCDIEAEQKRVYTRRTYAERMAELEKLTQKKGKDQAKNCYLFANGLYNMTNFGNSWYATNEYLNSSMAYDKVYGPEWFYDCSKAKEYYLKAMELSTNSEFSAECCLMASKCEVNAFFMEKRIYDDRNFDGFYAAVPLYEKMKNEYSTTAYYKEAIKECSYFADYVAHSGK